MFINFISESDAERIYGNTCLEITDEYDEETVQEVIDEWRYGLDESVLDSFGNIDYKDGVKTLEELAGMLPPVLKARVSETQQFDIFI